MSEYILKSVEDGVMTLTFNRPEKKNAINNEMYAALAASLAEAEADGGVRAVLFLSAGDSFTAGNDISLFARQAGATGGSDTGSAAQRFIGAIAGARKPLVAGVRGQAVGIGLTMLLHCDLVYVAHDAKLSAPFVSLGLVPEAASSLLLVSRLGHTRAFSVFAAGHVIDGSAAAIWGLASRAASAPEVDGLAREGARLLASRPPRSMALTKALMRDQARITAQIDREAVDFASQLASPEAQAAFRAFSERPRREPPKPPVYNYFDDLSG